MISYPHALAFHFVRSGNSREAYIDKISAMLGAAGEKKPTINVGSFHFSAPVTYSNAGISPRPGWPLL